MKEATELTMAFPLNCGHEFHRVCIDNTFKTAANRAEIGQYSRGVRCPMCKKEALLEWSRLSQEAPPLEPEDLLDPQSEDALDNGAFCVSGSGRAVRSPISK